MFDYIEMKHDWIVKKPKWMNWMEFSRYRFDPMTAMAMTMVVSGTTLSTMSTLSEGKEAAKLGKLEQLRLNQEAKAIEQAGRYEALQKRKEGRRIKGSQIASISATGGTLTGSNLVVMAQTAKEIEADALMIAQNAKWKATSLRTQGMISAYQGRYARYASRIRAMSGIMSSAGMTYLAAGAPKLGA